jgi:hypothetical protein
MRHILLLIFVLAILGCDRPPVADDEQKPTASDHHPKGVEKVDSWPVKRDYDERGTALWEYCVPYQSNIQKALDELRQREFKAGNFFRSELHPKTIDDAIRNADAPGTRSILDIEKVSVTHDIETVSPAPPDKLRQLFRTDKPSHAAVERASRTFSTEFFTFLETYGRVEGVYILLYDGDRPVEIYFAGWSAH